jgi:multicomponent K+:H+ antiporter subunit D
MNHAPILPILLPMTAALLQLAGARRGIAYQRVVGMAAVAASLALSLWLLALADRGASLVYALGDWPAPFGIVLVADRLSTLLVALTALLAAASLLFACGGTDGEGRHFHPLFQLQIAGVNGAFLTGDLFNLFVFFEVMLLASYVLLAHGGGLERTRAGMSYVTLNLAGSALFLIALGMIYGTLGTLNLADVALRLQTAETLDAALVRSGCALLIVVFALKAALLPMSFWLPHAYSAASAPVAALFAIMTKVGIVAMLRVQAVALAPAPMTANLLDGWLVPLALATLTIGALGTLAASRLQALAAWLVLASAGTLLFVPAYADAGITAAALYYLVQSTLATAALFLLAALVAAARGEAGDRLVTEQPARSPALAIGFLILAATAAGLPPLAGFLGKLMLLRAVQDGAAGSTIWTVLIVSGFLIMAALARGGSRLFWETRAETSPPAVAPAGWQRISATSILLGCVVAMTLLAQPAARYAARTAAQLHEPGAYVAGVLGPAASAAHAIEREHRP